MKSHHRTLHLSRLGSVSVERHRARDEVADRVSLYFDGGAAHAQEGPRYNGTTVDSHPDQIIASLSAGEARALEIALRTSREARGIPLPAGVQ